MRVDVYVPLVLSLMLAGASPLAARRLSPAHAARTLAVTGAVTALTSLWAMLLLGATLIDDSPPVLAQSREHRLHLPEPVPEGIAFAAIALIAVGLYRVGRVLRAHRATQQALQRLRATHTTDTELIVAASATPQAFAVPGRPGRILVTSAMLSGLDARERHVLLAHERAHLTHGHHRLRLTVDLIAALDPLLVPLRDTVGFLLERWADEDAADTVADRRITACALARAALLTQRSRAACALHFAELAVTRRVVALQHTPPTSARIWPAAVLALALIPAAFAADATRDYLVLFAGALSLY